MGILIYYIYYILYVLYRKEFRGTCFCLFFGVKISWFGDKGIFWNNIYPWLCSNQRNTETVREYLRDCQVLSHIRQLLV